MSSAHPRNSIYREKAICRFDHHNNPLRSVATLTLYPNRLRSRIWLCCDVATISSILPYKIWQNASILPPARLILPRAPPSGHPFFLQVALLPVKRKRGHRLAPFEKTQVFFLPLAHSLFTILTASARRGNTITPLPCPLPLTVNGKRLFCCDGVVEEKNWLQR